MHYFSELTRDSVYWKQAFNNEKEPLLDSMSYSVAMPVILKSSLYDLIYLIEKDLPFRNVKRLELQFAQKIWGTDGFTNVMLHIEHFEERPDIKELKKIILKAQKLSLEATIYRQKVRAGFIPKTRIEIINSSHLKSKLRKLKKKLKEYMLISIHLDDEIENILDFIRKHEKIIEDRKGIFRTQACFTNYRWN